MDTFKRDLKVGQRHEERILKKIRKNYPESYRIEGYFKFYDIFIPELGIGVEVKSDQKSQHTGNILIEIEFDGKPSALQVTKAQYWVIFDGMDDVWFKVGDIRKCIKDHKLKAYDFIGKGDSKYKKAYLIKKEILYEYKVHHIRTTNTL